MQSLEQYFINEQSDFFNYMMDNRLFKSRKTCHDYLSRLRYVSVMYKLDTSITGEDVENIVAELKKTMHQRDKYNTSKAVSDIASGLNCFLQYAQSDYKKVREDTVLAEVAKVQKDATLSETERNAIVKARVGQGLFRNNLIEYWKGCSVTLCMNLPLLVASHIQPWRHSSNEERIGVYNGLLLTPNLDKLFDKGYITFNRNGKMECSDSLPKSDRKILGLDDTMQLTMFEDKHQEYLKYHRDNCFL